MEDLDLLEFDKMTPGEKWALIGRYGEAGEFRAAYYLAARAAQQSVQADESHAKSGAGDTK